MKKLFSTIVFATFMVMSLLAQTPKDVLEEARNRASVKTLAAEAKVSTQQPAGTTVEILTLRQFLGEDSSGLRSTMIEFLGPAKYKGQRFLMIERKDGSNDQRVYLPSMGKSRRIAAESEGSSSFFGTDFSYNDMNFMSRNTDLDTHKFLPEEKYQGEDCYVIESIPKGKKETYSKIVSKITKDTKQLLCATFYNKNGKPEKFIELFDYKNISGIMTPMNIKMTTYSSNTATVMSVKQIKYGLKIPAQIFTTRYLETGR